MTRLHQYLAAVTKPAINLEAYPAPDGLVQLDVYPDISRPHGLLSELLDLLDCSWCPLLEGNVVQASMKMDGILPCGQILGAGPSVGHCTPSYRWSWCVWCETGQRPSTQAAFALTGSGSEAAMVSHEASDEAICGIVEAFACEARSCVLRPGDCGKPQCKAPSTSHIPLDYSAQLASTSSRGAVDNMARSILSSAPLCAPSCSLRPLEGRQSRPLSAPSARHGSRLIVRAEDRDPSGEAPSLAPRSSSTRVTGWSAWDDYRRSPIKGCRGSREGPSSCKRYFHRRQRLGILQPGREGMTYGSTGKNAPMSSSLLNRPILTFIPY